MKNIFENKRTEDRDGLEITIHWDYDNLVQPDWLGKLARKPPTDKAFIDRGEGVLIDAKGGATELTGYRVRANYDPRFYPYFIPANIDYAGRDWDRFERFLDHDWWLVGCRVTVKVNGYLLGYAALWGIESDCGEDATAEYEREVGAEALADARKDGIARLDSALAKARAAFAESEN